MPALDLLVRNTSEVLRVDGAPTDPAEQALGAVPRGALGVRAGKVAFIGSETDLPVDAIGPATEVIDAQGGFVGPGFVDPHTHLVFAGDRSAEFDLRCQGKSYLEIAKAGGGIASTVRATRDAYAPDLVQLALPRLERMLAQGITTAEVKSGYALTSAGESKMLRVIAQLSKRQPIELIPTLLCAHAIPEEFRDDRAGYVDLCCNEIIPSIGKRKMARFCDVFAEVGAFTLDEARRILEAGAKHGLIPRLHADQLSAFGAAELAAEVGAACADHLEFVSDRGIEALARAGVSAVLIPTTTLFLRQRPYAPGRKLRDAGCNVALGTNLNPGSAMTENLGVALSLACLENGLTAAEAYYAATRGAALALRRPELGQLVEGGPADFVVFDCKSYRHLPYHLGVNHAREVVKAGRRVVRSTAPRCAE